MTTLRSLDVDVEVQPLKQWPDGYDRTDEDERRSSQFESKGILDRTLDDLGRELRLLEAESVVLQVDIPQGRIRKSDGLPYANAKIGRHDPGVVLTFENDEGVHTYPCDTYREWTENLRAIAKTLKRLRDVARYGVGHGSEQYRGYTALPADVDERIGPDEAARILVSSAGYRSDENFEGRVDEALRSEDRAAVYLRRARKRSHPDSVTGNRDSFDRVQTAGDVLRQHHESGGGADDR